MRTILFTLLSFFTFPALANCEASIITGSHSAKTEIDASAGALEDAMDRCYPGGATPLSIECVEKSSDFSPGSTITACRHQVSCTLCNEGLQRKYEAID